MGAPGLILALVCLVLPDPVRGSSEGVDLQRLRLHERLGPSREDYVDLMVNSSYTYSVFGITFSSFSLAGLLYWSPTFLTAAKGLTEKQAAYPLLVTFLGAAILGTVVGSWLADRSAGGDPRPLFIMTGLGMIAAIPFILAAIYAQSMPLIFGGLFLAEGLMFMNVVPVYTILASVVMPNMRGIACAVALASIHLLGDIWSASLMGWAIDTFGQPDTMATIFGRALLGNWGGAGGTARSRSRKPHGRNARCGSGSFDRGNRLAVRLRTTSLARWHSCWPSSERRRADCGLARLILGRDREASTASRIIVPIRWSTGSNQWTFPTLTPAQLILTSLAANLSCFLNNILQISGATLRIVL